MFDRASRSAVRCITSPVVSTILSVMGSNATSTGRLVRPRSARFVPPVLAPFVVRLVVPLVVVALLGAAACSAGDDDSLAPSRPDPGDPEGLLPDDTGPALDWGRIEHPGFSLGYVVWSGTQFVTVNTREDGRTELLTSPDGTTWTDAGRTFDDIEVRDLAVSRDALAVWGTVRGSGDPDTAPTNTSDRIHFSSDNGTTWHQRDIVPPGIEPGNPNPGSSIVTAAIRGTTVLVSAFFRDDGASSLLRLDLDPDRPDDATFEPVALDPPDTFIGDITVTAGGIVMIGADAESSRIYTEGPNGWDRVDPDTRIATLLSDGRILYANGWEDYQLLESQDLGATWRPLEQGFDAFSQTFVGPSGVGGTTTISTSEPWAIPSDTGPPTIGAEALDRGRAETFLSWSTDGTRWHHETTTSSFGFPAFTYLAIGDGVVLAAATPLFGEPYEEGTIATELYRATID